MKKRLLWIAGGIVLLALAGFAYYAISPIFIHIEADDALPANAQIVEPAALPHKVDKAVSEGVAGKVMGTIGHPASGTARIIEADGKTYVRYENFSTLNGPDLYVYLAKDPDASEYVDLGKLRATEGNINYEIPAGIDVSEYPYVLTWCKAFSVLFNYARIGM